MNLIVDLDDDLVRCAREYSGLTEISAVLHEALQALIHREASRRLAALGGTMPDLEHIPHLKFGSEA